jgi:NitT/TauT family transport system permease protein
MAPYLFPGPLVVANSLASLWQRYLLPRSLVITLYRLGIGFGLALILGSLLAVVMVHFPPVGRGLQPYVLGLQTFPSIAWVPLSILWFGFSETALLFVTIIGSLFAVTISFFDALRTVPPTYLRAARNMGCEGVTLIVRVSIPAALPHLISAAKSGWSFAWRSLIGAEIIFATAGLGFLLNQGRDFLDTSQVVAMMITILLLGVLFDRWGFSKVQEWVGHRWGLIGSH